MTTMRNVMTETMMILTAAQGSAKWNMDGRVQLLMTLVHATRLAVEMDV